VAHQLIWITPSEVTGPQRSYERVTASLGDSAEVTLKGLEVWETDAWDGYGLHAEVEGIARVAGDRRLDRFHLFGFSAGATVALGAALSLGEAVESLTVFEPATIGDDDWALEEAAWRMDMARVCNEVPVGARRAAFAQMMLPSGAAAPTVVPSTAAWTARTDLLEAMLARVGFSSGALAAIRAPCLVLTGGRSHPRFAQMATRLMQVLPKGRTSEFPSRSHLSPPMREEPAKVAELLRELWESGTR
jgi:pimeloyl-ACP methyl ester carboxylesterase